MAQPGNVGYYQADHELILARALVWDDVAKDHLTVEASYHKALDDLAVFAGFF